MSGGEQDVPQAGLRPIGELDMPTPLRSPLPIMPAEAGHDRSGYQPGNSPDGRERGQPSSWWGFHGGGGIDLLDPDWRKLDLGAVAAGLAAMPRWNGQLSRTVSVAEHSLMVCSLVPQPLKLAALLHDAHEWALGDLSRPFEAALGQLGGWQAKAALGRMRTDMDLAIVNRVLRAAGVAVQSPDVAKLIVAEMRLDVVKEADTRAALVERAQFGGVASRGVPRLYPPDAPEPGNLAYLWEREVLALAAERFAVRSVSRTAAGAFASAEPAFEHTLTSHPGPPPRGGRERAQSERKPPQAGRRPIGDLIIPTPLPSPLPQGEREADS